MIALAAGLLFWTLARSSALELTLPFSAPQGQASADRAYGELPLAFERDAGRSGPNVDFLARTPVGTTLVGPAGATLMLGDRKHAETLGLELAGGAAAVEPLALERLPGEVNYLVGERSQWKTEIATFERVRYPDVYPGIALDWRGNQQQLEYDFRLAPGADPSRIALDITGAEALHIAGGDLVIEAGRASVRQRAPIAYQTIAGERQPVEASFALDRHTIGFELGAYDRSRPLVIDPLVLAYSTYLGGSGSEFANGIAVDSAGAAYVTGETGSADFDTVGPIESDDLSFDAFVSKLNPAGNALVYSTYIGGNSFDGGNGIAVDSSGAAYITGQTTSTDYCTTGCSVEADPPQDDAFVSKLTPGGDALAYSTYLGGDSFDFGNAIAVDSSGAAYVAGRTDSTDYCTGGGCSIEPDPPGEDAFISKLNPAGALSYSTYLGGNSDEFGSAVAVDSSGAAYVTGRTDSTDYCAVASCSIEPDPGDGSTDAFVSKLTPAGNALAYSTYLGGDSFDFGYGIAVDTAGAAYVTGDTGSADFNSVGAIEGDSANFDGFISKLTPAGNALAYSTYLGGDSFDSSRAIAVDSRGAAYVAGETNSADFNTVGQIEGDSDSAIRDAFISKLAPAGNTLAYSTYLGGSLDDRAAGIAVDSAGGAYVTGFTDSTDFNTVGPIQGDLADANGDAFISKLSFDADGDGIPDDADACPTQAGSAADGGCPASPAAAKSTRTLTLDASKSKVKKGKKVGLSGQIDSPVGAACEATQTLELQRVKKGTKFKTFTTDKTNATGKFTLKVKVKKTYRYRAELGESATCLADTSNTEKVKVKRKR